MAAGQDALKPDLRRDVACPFCGLVCDDLEIEVAGQGLTVRRGACPISRAQFERPLPTEAAAQAAGVPCDRGEAIAQAARILRQCRLPVFGGLATDVEGLRGALALADRLGGVVDHRGSRGLFSDLTALRDIGTMTTTFSEVRNRADLLLIVGPDPFPAAPRFLERCFSDQPTLFAEGGIERRLIRLGPPSDVPPALPKGVRYSHIPCAPEELAPTVGRLRAILKGRSASARRGCGPDRTGGCLSHGELCRGFLDGRAAAARCGGPHRAERWWRWCAISISRGAPPAFPSAGRRT